MISLCYQLYLKVRRKNDQMPGYLLNQPGPKKSPLRPTKGQNDPKIKSNQKSQFKETEKILVVNLHE